jgi:uncharacterized protein YfaP (DUF2135 family)
LIIIFFTLGFAEQTWGINIEASGGATRERNFPLVISEAAGKLITVVHNGIPMIMKSYDSYRILSLSRGINSIVAADMSKEQADSSPSGVDNITVYADVAPVPLKIIHMWDSANNYVDLYVKEPTGEECFWSHRQTELGGILDIGSDTVGYGPQIYTMPYLNSGVYEIFVNYYEHSETELTEITTYIILHEGTEKEQRQKFQAILTAPGERIFIGKIELK